MRTFYHATFGSRMTSIRKTGLCGQTNKSKRNWEDSAPDLVYLALDPFVAESFAESSEDASDRDIDSGIVIFEIQESELDSSLLFPDPNVAFDHEVYSFAYRGIIGFEKLKSINGDLS